MGNQEEFLKGFGVVEGERVTACFRTSARHILSACNEEHSGVTYTPERFARAMKELLSGYWDDPSKYVKVFEDVRSSSMIVQSPIHFVSLCEHHLVPFFGEAHVGYLPSEGSKEVIGLSKLIRIFRCFSNRLQVQERIGEQFVDFIMANLHCDGVICVIDAQHMCISERGAKSYGTKATTSAFRGSFELPEVRSEFFSLLKR